MIQLWWLIPALLRWPRPPWIALNLNSFEQGYPLAKHTNLQPRTIAEIITKALNDENLLTPAGISKVEIAGPGFINITLEVANQGSVVSEVLKLKEKFGTGSVLSGKKINLEFVSANPTGPIHLGHTRWG